MSSLAPTSQMTFRNAVITVAAIVVAIVSAPITASAIDGRTAVGICIDSTASGARCAWSVNDKGEIDICNQSGCVTCPSATEQCSVASRGRPRPGTVLPIGATVTTAVGEFKVSPRKFNFKAFCPRGQIRCPLLGCVPTGDCDFPRSSGRR
jgi:hypothetical protein